MACPLCRQRKAKRACPGVGHDICTVCCGTKRLTEIVCPPDCVYLESAQRHPAAAVKRQMEQDLEVLMGALGQLSEPELQLFFLIQTFITRFAPAAGAPLTDRDVAEAVGALASTYETADRGVIYEHQAASLAAEALRRELKAFLTEIGARGGTRFDRAAATVLRGIQRGAAHDAPGVGAGAVDYLQLAARVLQERPPNRHGSSASLILP